MLLRTEARLVAGTVELEERIVVSVKGDRLRQEATGSRAVVTRRGARYTKPGKSLTLDQLDRGRRFEIDPDTGTYVEQAFADIRRRREAELSGAEDRKSTRLNSSHITISYAVFCLKKKKHQTATAVRRQPAGQHPRIT